MLWPRWRPWRICWLTSRAGRTRSRRIETSMRMEIKRGIPVSPGVAIGPALVLDNEGFRIPHRFLDNGGGEVEVGRLRHALAAAAQESLEHERAITAKLGK